MGDKITREQYEQAKELKKMCDSTIKQFEEQEKNRYEKKWEEFLINKRKYTDEELVYSAFQRCSCGAGLAHPVGADPVSFWYCSRYLSGVLIGVGDSCKREKGRLCVVNIREEIGEQTTRPKERMIIPDDILKKKNEDNWEQGDYYL